MGNCHSFGEQRSVRTQTLGAIPVFKPLTGQCTGMAPICIKRDLSHDGVEAGMGVGLGDHHIDVSDIVVQCDAWLKVKL